MKIYCTGCQKEVEARLTSGKEIYPHRPDLHQIPFWKCDTCGNYVGCHWKTNKPTKPLGVIATREILDARIKIHAVLDPIWKTRALPRGVVYSKISKQLGYKYHTGEIRTLEEARRIYSVVAILHNQYMRKGR